MTILKMVLVLNVVSCLIFRLWWGGRMEIEVKHHNRYDSNYQIYLAGMMNQPEVAFRLVCDLKAQNTVLMRYSPFGWSAKKAAEQLQEFCDEQESLLICDVYAISVGDKVLRYLPRNNRVFECAINPCPSPATLKPALRRLLPLLAVLLKIVRLGLGWLSVIPYLPMEDGRCFYSFALITDQVWQIAMVNPPAEIDNVAAVIMSAEDEFLDNDAVKRYFPDVPQETIKTQHARTGDPEAAVLYREFL